MPSYVAFLRSINVGGRRATMDRLCSLFEELDYSDVSTFIASGNVLFQSPQKNAARLETCIEGHLHKALGYPVETFVRTPAEIARAVAHEPFEVRETDSLHVVFLRDRLDLAAAKSLAKFRTEMDELHAHGRELYWLCRGRLTESLLKWPHVTKAIGMPSTARNVTSLRKLLAKLG
ncbi:MAG: DUF1697 domain-containing protein [Gemmataceae bacterium]|nr:DUF1697 domain-containing protein [Gemmataceae bacterium]